MEHMGGKVESEMKQPYFESFYPASQTDAIVAAPTANVPNTT